MTSTYLYLDDAPAEEILPFIEKVASFNSDLRIDLSHPRKFSDELMRIIADGFDGTILDLRLDQTACVETSGAEMERVDYRATTLAQEMRTRATEGEYRDRPIVLWSTEANLWRSYQRDDTGHDLFDLKCIKDQILDDCGAARIAEQLVALAAGYPEIDSVKGNGLVDLRSVLGLDAEAEFVDPRIINYFGAAGGPVPTHEIARFVLRNLLDHSGPLIDRDTLASRLGIDIEASPDFDRVLEAVTSAEYCGVFRAGWPRWWNHLVERWWSQMVARRTPLRATNAEQRVEVLKSHLGLGGIQAAKPLNDEYSSRFWCVCLGTRRPLDPRDGFMISVHPNAPVWQERYYTSREGMNSGNVGRLGLRLDPLDEARFQQQA